MNKDEILKKSRSENLGQPDERETMLFANASKVGMTVGGVLSMVMVMLSKVFDTPVLGLSAWSIYFAMFGSRCAYQYRKTKESSWLIKSVIGSGAALVFFISLIILELKK